MIFSRFSRLVIDANRGEDDPTLVMRLYDGTIIPGNRHVGADDVSSRLTRFHRPYHAEIRRIIASKSAQGLEPVLVSIHSFTPRLRGRGPRPWHIGVLWGGDGRLARPLLASLRQLPGICVGDNEPYAGQLPGDTLHEHGLKRGLLHVLVEFRHDLIADAAGQIDWAQRILPALTDAIAHADKGNADG